MNAVNQLAEWALIVGFFVPIVTAIVTQQAWASSKKAVANFIVATVAAFPVVYFEGNLDVDNLDSLIQTVLLVVVASIASYKGITKPTGVTDRIEAATSPGSEVR